MDWNRVEGNWKQVQGKARQQWGRLTDNDQELDKGKRDELAGRIQERYGIAKDAAEHLLDVRLYKATMDAVYRPDGYPIRATLNP